MLTEREILDNIFDIILKNSDKVGSYAFKGGYVLSKYYFKEARCTTDIDMSISDVATFNMLLGYLKPYLDSLVNSNEIFTYRYRVPKIVGNRSISGSIGLCRKRYEEGVRLENQKTVIFCKIDISIHDLSFGLMTQNDKVISFSVERMLTDKLSVLYLEKDKVFRRIRDCYDIYLYDSLNYVLNNEVFRRCLKYRNIDIYKITTFEKLVNTDSISLKNSLNEFLKSGDRADILYVKDNNITADLIIDRVLKVLDMLREGLK